MTGAAPYSSLAEWLADLPQREAARKARGRCGVDLVRRDQEHPVFVSCDKPIGHGDAHQNDKHGVAWNALGKEGR